MSGSWASGLVAGTRALSGHRPVPSGQDLVLCNNGLHGAHPFGAIGCTTACQPQSAVIGTVVTADAVLDCSAISPNGARGNPAASFQGIGPVRGSTTFQLWGADITRGRATGLTSGLVKAVVLDATGAVTRS
jgi:hypothetical protein